MFHTDRDYQAALDRWPDWRPEIRLVRHRPFWWQGTWFDPLNSKLTMYGLPRGSILRQVRRELARWTRKRNRVRRQHRELVALRPGGGPPAANPFTWRDPSRVSR